MKRTSKLTIGIILTLSSIFVIAAIFFGSVIFYSVNQELKIENNLSEIDYLDIITLDKALEDRKKISE